MSLYKNAHLIVSAIRILEHQTGTSPSIEDVCHTLSFSIERGNMIIRKLCEMNILEIMEGAFGTRLFIIGHQAIEHIPRGQQVDRLQQELEKFQSSRKEKSQKIESFKAQQAHKKKNLFAEIEKKLKKDLDHNR
jgi:uncharacterized FAD-dependent dehydrogenase